MSVWLRCGVMRYRGESPDGLGPEASAGLLQGPASGKPLVRVASAR